MGQVREINGLKKIFKLTIKQNNMELTIIVLIFALIFLIGMILCIWAAMNGNKVLMVCGVISLIGSIGFLVIAGISQSPSYKPAKPVYSFLARNLEDMQLDTVYTYNLYPSSEVWVNMDSFWINSYRSNDLYATKYSIIRKIK